MTDVPKLLCHVPSMASIPRFVISPIAYDSRRPLLSTNESRSLQLAKDWIVDDRKRGMWSVESRFQLHHVDDNMDFVPAKELRSVLVLCLSHTNKWSWKPKCFGPVLVVKNDVGGLQQPSDQGIGSWQACHELMCYPRRLIMVRNYVFRRPKPSGRWTVRR
ncbi:hypothetical protein TNCV_2127011 [Trichonephila clavipes]|nr:hypothetical protein TNCV_2127011 [Trichonephila clavipes]